MLVRPTPFLGESWPGYLLRLAQINQLGGIQVLGKMIGLSPSELVASKPATVLQNFNIQVPTDVENSLGLPLKGKLHLAMYGRTLKARICPQCARSAELFFIPASWDLPFSQICLLHRSALLEMCPECSTQISYLRPSLGHCGCGFKFAQSSTKRLTIDLQDFYSILGLTAIYRAQAGTFGAASIAEIDAVILIRRLAWLIQGAARRTRALGRRSDAFVDLTTMSMVNALFHDWPYRFIEFLNAKLFSKGRNPTYVLLKGAISDVHSLSMVRLALKDLSRLRQTSLHPRTRSLAVQKHADSITVGIRYLIDSTGCTYDVAQFWIEKGWLGHVAVIHQPSNQKKYAIGKQAVQKAIQIVKSTSSLSELSKSIGLERRVLYYLAKAAVITSVPYGRAYWSVRLVPQEVFALTEQLMKRAVASRASSSQRLILNRAILRLGKRSPELVKPFIATILEGKLAVGSYVHPPKSLDDLSLKLVDFESWQVRVRCRHALA
jgi:sulfur transfer complex TusBCD TusB component (DsrH family)